MSEGHKHRWQIFFTTRNVYVRNPEQYWYVFICADWKCSARRLIDRGKFWVTNAS